jgi:hypothetical protein
MRTFIAAKQNKNNINISTPRRQISKLFDKIPQPENTKLQMFQAKPLGNITVVSEKNSFATCDKILMRRTGLGYSLYQVS